MTRARRLAVAPVLGLAVVLASLLATGAATEHATSGSRGTAAPAAERPGAIARVAYVGPRARLSGASTLRARVRGGGQRVVAVTFLFDGRPLGTDATAPYALDPGELPGGAHEIQVQAVDRLGRRSSSPVTRVRVHAQEGDVLRASPEAGLGRALAALARGHVTVELAAGRYSMPPLRLGNGARLRGAGPDTVLTPATGAPELIRVHGRRVRVTDLAIDGLGRVGRTIGVADGSSDVRLSRLALSGMTEHGVEVWGAHRDVSVQDSTITGGGRAGAGVLELGSEDSRDMSVVRCFVAGFRAYGIDFAQRDYGSRTAALHALALDNRVEAIQDPSAADGTHEGGIWSGGVAAAIVGNQIRDTGWDGIQTVGSSTGVTVVDNEIAGTRVGIYLEHETNRSLFAGNRISGVITGINVEWRYDRAGSSDNTFTGNRIEGATESGLFVDVAGDRNRITGNVIAGGGGEAIVLQGASDNLVSDNVACGRGGDPVRLQSARFEDGRAAHSLRNRVEANRALPSCAGL